MLGVFFNLIYMMVLLVASPWIIYRSIVHGKYREGWKQKLFGLVPKRESQNECIWFHGVSVGEVLQVESIINRFQNEHPDLDIVLTTTTQTGFKVAKEKYPDIAVHYFPLDFTWAVRNAIQRIRPSLICLIELELWPNSILEASKQSVPLLLINARMSANSFKGYRKIRPLVSKLLQKFDGIAAQNETYANRLLDLGADSNSLSVTGSIKYDQTQIENRLEQCEQLRNDFGLNADDIVLMAGSTHAPEEEIVLQSYRELRKEFPSLKLLLVPRHAERFEDVANLVSDAGFELSKRSETLSGGKIAPNNSVLLLDTLGELSAAWGLASIAFVGGSLCSRGGQNMIEPAAWGKPVLFGTNTSNFKDVTESLLDQQAAIVVSDGSQLTKAIRNLLQDSATCSSMGKNAKQFVENQKGASEKTFRLIENFLPHTNQSNPQIPQKQSRCA